MEEHELRQKAKVEAQLARALTVRLGSEKPSEFRAEEYTAQICGQEAHQH